MKSWKFSLSDQEQDRGAHGYRSDSALALGNLARTIKQEKEIEGIPIRKEEVELSLFVDDMKILMILPKTIRPNEQI